MPVQYDDLDPETRRRLGLPNEPPPTDTSKPPAKAKPAPKTPPTPAGKSAPPAPVTKPAGPAPAAAPRAAPTEPKRRFNPITTKPGPVNTGAGFILGVLGWALLRAYLHGGIPEARGWLAAKFLNRPYAAGGSAPAPAPASPAKPAPAPPWNGRPSG